ncbi:MAG: Extra-cytoplasmic solute receptor [Rhodospirillales bacterium]|nr:Extra-cytoplasmic solute receptor [Rhodospirillales bacterium]
MTRILGAVLAFACSAIALLAPHHVAAQDYPTKNITIICNFPAGTGADIYVRYFVEPLQKKLGKTVIVENKGGAQGNIGTEFAARQKPDGYTILIAPGSSTMAAAPSLFKQLGFDPKKDFAPVTTLVRLGFVIVVDAKSPHKTLADLTEAMKKKGEAGRYGLGSNTGLVAAELYKNGYGLKTKPVRYQGAMEGLNDLLGGQVDFYSMDSAFAQGQIAAGKIRALAQTTSFRATGFENVPTVQELKVPNFTKMEPWWAAYVPAGTPKPIIDKLEAAFNEIVKMPETKAFFNKLGGEPYAGDRNLLAKIQAEEMEAWKTYVKLADIKPI